MSSRTRDLWEVNKYLWICLLFAALFIPFARAHSWLVAPLEAAYGLLIVAVANGAARTYVGWKRGGTTDRAGWVFSAIDIALISAAVRMTRALESELWLLFLVLVVSESIFATDREAVGLIGVVVAGYVCATWVDHRLHDYWLIVTIRMFFMVVAAAFARRLAGDRERRTMELSMLREQVAASDERGRIAREVHDSLGHALVASILRLELCLRLLRRDPDEAEKILAEEVPALRSAWNQGRDLAFHLRPWERDASGLVPSLRRNVSRFAERTGLSVDFTCVEECPLRPDAELALIRIMQEALTNVAKHASAERVAIALECSDGKVTCAIRDDGVGFVPDDVAGSFGLRAMRERAENLGGDLRVSSRPGEGTTVEATLPAA